MTKRLSVNAPTPMRLDEFLELTERLVMDKATALLDPADRWTTDGTSPTGEERRNPLQSDLRPRLTTAAGKRWLEDEARWIQAREAFWREGRPIDAMLRAWSKSGGAFHNIVQLLITRTVSMSSEDEALVFLIGHILDLERSGGYMPPKLSGELTAQGAVKRAGIDWQDIKANERVSAMNDAQTRTQRTKRGSSGLFGNVVSSKD